MLHVHTLPVPIPHPGYHHQVSVINIYTTFREFSRVSVPVAEVFEKPSDIDDNATTPVKPNKIIPPDFQDIFRVVYKCEFRREVVGDWDGHLQSGRMNSLVAYL